MASKALIKFFNLGDEFLHFFQVSASLCIELDLYFSFDCLHLAHQVIDGLFLALLFELGEFAWLAYSQESLHIFVVFELRNAH